MSPSHNASVAFPTQLVFTTNEAVVRNGVLVSILDEIQNAVVQVINMTSSAVVCSSWTCSLPLTLGIIRPGVSYSVFAATNAVVSVVDGAPLFPQPWRFTALCAAATSTCGAGSGAE